MWVRVSTCGTEICCNHGSHKHRQHEHCAHARVRRTVCTNILPRLHELLHALRRPPSAVRRLLCSLAVVSLGCQPVTPWTVRDMILDGATRSQPDDHGDHPGIDPALSIIHDSTVIDSLLLKLAPLCERSKERRLLRNLAIQSAPLRLPTLVALAEKRSSP